MKSFFKVTKIAPGLYRVSGESGREIGKIHEGHDGQSVYFIRVPQV